MAFSAWYLCRILANMAATRPYQTQFLLRSIKVSEIGCALRCWKRKCFPIERCRQAASLLVIHVRVAQMSEYFDARSKFRAKTVDHDRNDRVNVCLFRRRNDNRICRSQDVR